MVGQKELLKVDQKVGWMVDLKVDLMEDCWDSWKVDWTADSKEPQTVYLLVELLVGKKAGETVERTADLKGRKLDCRKVEQMVGLMAEKMVWPTVDSLAYSWVDYWAVQKVHQKVALMVGLKAVLLER